MINKEIYDIWTNFITQYKKYFPSLEEDIVYLISVYIGFHLYLTQINCHAWSRKRPRVFYIINNKP